MKSATLRIARHEIRQILREPKFLFPFLFPPVLLLVSQMMLLPRDAPSWMFSRMMLFCALLVSPMVVPLASDTFAGERERGSLELLLLLPVRPSAVFYGKLLALLPVPLLLLALSETVYAAASGMFVFSVWWKSVLAGFLACVFFAGISLFVSLSVKTARAANQISLVFVFAFLPAFVALADFYMENCRAPLLLSAFVAVVFFSVSALSFRKFRKS